jgi:UrcA family protein
MKRLLCGFALALAAVAIGGSGAYGQDVEGIIVKGSRMVVENIGRSPSGVPISEISLSYKVNYSDLDLGTTQGKAALEKRINDAARAACKEIGRLHPGAKPDDADCAKAAVDEAMIRMREAIAAAGK